MTKKDTPLQARIRAGRNARFGALEELRRELMSHIDTKFDTLHERLDGLEKKKK